MFSKKIKIYIAYKQKDVRRRSCIENIKNILENDFNFSAWYDKGIRGGAQWPQECSRKMDWANNFLLVAHKDTHKSTVVPDEINVAYDKLKNKQYKNLVVLKMHPAVVMKKYIAFIRTGNYIKGYVVGWKDELQQAFLPKRIPSLSQNKIYEDLYSIIGGTGSKKEKEAKELIQKVLNSRKMPDNLIEALQLLHANTNNKKQKVKIQDMVNILKKEDILKKHSKKIEPARRVVSINNKMLRDIQTRYSRVYHDACRLYEGLIYLLKPFNTKDTSVLTKIRSLGITKEIEVVIKKELLDRGIAVQVGDTLWIEDNNLGRKLMDEVFFGKRPLVDFSNIERLFYGQN